jgi:hypothetical protein
MGIRAGRVPVRRAPSRWRGASALPVARVILAAAGRADGQRSGGIRLTSVWRSRLAALRGGRALAPSGAQVDEAGAGDDVAQRIAWSLLVDPYNTATASLLRRDAVAAATSFGPMSLPSRVSAGIPESRPPVPSGCT